MAVRSRSAAPAGPPSNHNLAPDLFVLVRPPPSHSTHPLNLQIQLLVPSIARGEPPNGRRSGEYSTSSSRNGSVAEGRGEGPSGSIGGGNSAVSFDAIAGASVSRSGSRSSDTHDHSGHLQVAQAGPASGGRESGLTRTSSRGSTRSRASTNSVSTSASTSGGTGARRRVTPLLNLNFHSVLPTVVTDAGTDQRVSKFLKRGIEMSNLAIIDPIDLSQPPPSDPDAGNIPPLSQGSPARNGSSVTTPAASANTTPTNNLFTKFKRFTLGGSPSPKPSSSSPSQQQAVSSPTASSFSLFSRSTSTSSNLSSTSGPASPSTSKFLPSLVSSEGAPTPRTVPLLRNGSDDATTSNLAASSLRTSAAPPSAPPSTSATAGGIGYAFVVRKWLRDDLVGVSEAGGVPGPNTQIRIEWVRASDQEYRRMGKGGSRRAGASRDRSQTRGSDTGSSRRSSEIVEGTIPPVVPENEELETTTRSREGDSGTESGEGPTRLDDDDEGEGDDGESSDPEDSERPFICTLFYPSSSSSSSSSHPPLATVAPLPPHSTTPTTMSSTMSASPPSSSSMQQTPSLRRLQLATLRPAPHHPKLIATLLLPPTLPSIPLGSFSPAHGLQGGVLSNETLRDVVHVTSMWISIREGLGGLGREKDVQHIAAGLGLVKVKSSGLKVARTFKGLRK